MYIYCITDYEKEKFPAKHPNVQYRLYIYWTVFVQ